MSSEDQGVTAYQTGAAILVALGYEPTAANTGTDAEGFGVGFSVEAWPTWRLKFHAVYPGPAHTSEYIDARVSVDRDPKAAAADIRRRVLEPARKHLPAIRERHAEAQAEAARRQRIRESLTDAGWIERRSSGLETYKWPGAAYGRGLVCKLHFWTAYAPEGYRIELEATGLRASEVTALARLWDTFSVHPDP